MYNHLRIKRDLIRCVNGTANNSIFSVHFDQFNVEQPLKLKAGQKI